MMKIPSTFINALVLIAFFMIPLGSHAIDRTFTGDSSNLWSDADNWSPTGVPSAGDNVILTGEDVDFGSTNITIVNLSVTGSSAIDGDGTFTFQNVTISGSRTLTTERNVVLSQGATNTCSFGNKANWTIKHSKNGTITSLGIINLGNFSRLLWTGQRDAFIQDLNLADYNLVEFSNGTTTFGVAQDWDENCNTAAILRSRLAGNDAKLVFVGTGNTGEFNVYEDVNSTAVNMDIANSKKLNVVGLFTGGSTASTTIVSSGSGDFNNGATWVGGCAPKHLDSVVILDGHTVDIPAQYFARVKHLYIEGTGNIDGPNSGVLEVEGNLRVNSESCFSGFTGVTEFRSIDDAIITNESGTTVKFGGPVRKEIGGTTLTLQDTVWFESSINGRGDITVTRGTLDCGAFNVYLENDLNVGNNGILVPGTSKWIAKGTAGEITTLDIDGTGHFYDLVLDKENDIDFIECQSNIEIANMLTLQTGICQSFSLALLILRDGATSGVGNSTSYVDGPMKKVGDEAFTYPVGDRTGGANYFAPIGITAPSAATDEFTAEYFFAEPTDKASYVSAINLVSHYEYWDLSRDAGSSSVSVTLAFNPFSSTAGDIGTLSDLRVAHYNTGASEWEDMGLASSTGTGASGTITSNLVSSFSPFTIATAGVNPVPVEFIYVSANAVKQNEAEVKWEVASELNNKGFFVEKYDAERTEFVSKGYISSLGNTNARRTYQFVDRDAVVGQNVYRIKQVDFSGEFSYSEVANARLGESKGTVKVFPNPSKNVLFIENNEEIMQRISILSTTGKVLLTQIHNNETARIDVSSLSTGIYLVKVYTDSNVVTRSIAIAK